MIIDQYEQELKETKKVIDSIKSFHYDSITLYGSAYNDKTFVNDLSDIDLIIMSKDFENMNLNKIIYELKSMGINFREKEPQIIIDSLCKRIELYIQYEKISIDLTLCGGLIPSKESLMKNAWYDSFEALMGGIYIHSKTLFGTIPDFELFKKEFNPFYNEEIRKARLKIVAEKLESYNKKIKYNYELKNNETVDNLIKARKFFMKLLFIFYKQYYWSPEKHIRYQLDSYLNLDNDTKDKITLSKGDMFECAKNYLEVSGSYLRRIKKEL